MTLEQKPIWGGNQVGAFIFDFDKTLSPLYMQAPIFKALNVDEKKFWTETNGRALETASKLNTTPNFELAYMYSLLDLPGFKDLDLEDIGLQVPLYPGVVELFKKLREIKYIEVYIVSSGLKEVIKGTPIYDFCSGVYSCEFDRSYPIWNIQNTVSAVHKCNIIDWLARGCNVLGFDYFPPVGTTDRRISYKHMVYVGDGASDIPAFNLVKGKGGDTWGVFNPLEPAQLDQLETIRQDGRLSGIGVANYNLDHTTGIWLLERAKMISNEILRIKEKEVQDTREQYLKKVPSFVHSWTKRSE
jgi:2-hydroxy-3-keto-5-methylthiopentenyl-1-phosphate phosphatase